MSCDKCFASFVISLRPLEVKFISDRLNSQVKHTGVCVCLQGDAGDIAAVSTDKTGTMGELASLLPLQQLETLGTKAVEESERLASPSSCTSGREATGRVPITRRVTAIGSLCPSSLYHLHPSSLSLTCLCSSPRLQVKQPRHPPAPLCSPSPHRPQPPHFSPPLLCPQPHPPLLFEPK